MTLHAFLEPVAFILRLYDGEAAEGQAQPPYIGTANVTLDDRGVASVRGLVIQPGHAGRGGKQAILSALGRIGCGEVLFSRRLQNGAIEYRTLAVPSPAPRLYL